MIDNLPKLCGCPAGLVDNAREPRACRSRALCQTRLAMASVPHFPAHSVCASTMRQGVPPEPQG